MSQVSFSILYCIWGSCVVCVVCGPQPDDGGDGGRKPLLTEDSPVCMSRIIHFQEKEKKNLIDIVSMKVPSAPLSKNVSSAVRRTIGWQGNGRCGLNETVLIEIRTSVGFATVQTPCPCHRKADKESHYFIKISATDDRSFCVASEFPLSWNVKY